MFPINSIPDCQVEKSPETKTIPKKKKNPVFLIRYSFFNLIHFNTDHTYRAGEGPRVNCQRASGGPALAGVHPGWSPESGLPRTEAPWEPRMTTQAWPPCLGPRH